MDKPNSREISDHELPGEYSDKTTPKPRTKIPFGKGILIALVSSMVTMIVSAAAFLYIVLPEIKNNTLDRPEVVFNNDDETLSAVNKINEIITLLRNNYYTELTDAQIVQAMAQALPSALDNPYTYYLSQEQYLQTQESMKGNYVGIGCSVSQNPQGGIQVMEVYPDSPAEEAGLLPGDFFIAVDGIDVSRMKDTNEIAALVRGEEGTAVSIEIWREATGKNLSFTMTRRLIQHQYVRYEMLDQNTGYIQIRSFAQGADNDFISAMDDLQSEGAENVVIDLRFNSGGSADIMIHMLEYIFPPNTLLAQIKGRNNGEEYTVDWTTKEKAHISDEMDFAILTNEFSASASEFFAGCLRDHGKAVLIGQTTFGKGSGTATYELTDGSAVTITIFRYYLPQGELVEGKGIRPDIEVEIPDEYRYISVDMIPEGFDTILARALEELD
jgi:carboxyl-terminal processing protease